MSAVSVIIATYNYGKYLPDALRSLQNQSLGDWECIVIDDGSTDDTGTIVKAFAEKDQRIIYTHQANQGVSAARNIGLALAKGEFIQFLDADDMLQPGKLDMHVRYLTRNKECTMVFSDFIHVNDSSELANATGELPEEYRKNFSPRELLSALLRGNFIRINAVLLRASLLKNVRTFHSPLRSVEDWDFWLRCAASGAGLHFVSGENGFAVIRRSSEGLSKDIRTMKRHYIAVLQRLYYSGKVSGLMRCRIFLRAAFNACLFWLSGQPVDFDNVNRARFKMGIITMGILLFPFALLYRIKG